MRKIWAAFLTAALLLSLTACGRKNEGDGKEAVTPPVETHVADQAGGTDTTPETAQPEGSGILIAYFSATNNTEGVAKHLSGILDADLYEIEPELPYTGEDLDYNTDCRANREQNDDGARPAISGSVEDMERYDVVFLGYPIWWGQAPKIIYTFLESYDLSGKTVVPFCTSGSSGIGSSAENLHGLAEGAEWLDGQRFSAGTSEEEVKTWVEGLSLPLEEDGK